jgi:hypothetical protein
MEGRARLPGESRAATGKKTDTALPSAWLATRPSAGSLVEPDGLSSGQTGQTDREATLAKGKTVSLHRRPKNAGMSARQISSIVLKLVLKIGKYEKNIIHSLFVREICAQQVQNTQIFF